jgi:dTDP-L-rhamnose 4-epimerase
MKRVLITGGAGFIGSHLTDELLQHGYEIRILDNLSEQVHGGKRPTYLSPHAELQVGDVRDARTVRQALAQVDVVCHLAAAVGVGQSMYQIAGYTSVNNLGTAVLLEELARRPVERLLVASSMSLYGEGLYRDHAGRVRHAEDRSLAQLRDREWDVRGDDGTKLEPAPTPETKAPGLTSVYAVSKFDQERLCLVVGRAYQVPTTALRFFNTYGPRQALSNPYTGVLAIFASRLLNGNPPLIFEDGRQMRDFVSVHDVARACRLALEVETGPSAVINVGSGQPRSVLDVARAISKALNKEIPPMITGQYRVGDIRHCFADITQAKRMLGYEPQVSFEDGLCELAAWLEQQTAVDRAVEARSELEQRGLTL